MIHAYNEIYLDDAMITLAELFSYVNTPNDADVLFDAFINSGKSFQFERGNCKYLTMPSHALFNELVDGKIEMITPSPDSRSITYWCGYVLAYYQWYTGLSFKEIKRSLPPSKIIEMYSPLHEADISKFVQVANSMIRKKETNLALLRKKANISQKQLAFYSKVSLRSIQLYEQRRLDINEAPAIKLYQLSRVFGCNMEDLLEKNIND